MISQITCIKAHERVNLNIIEKNCFFCEKFSEKFF